MLLPSGAALVARALLTAQGDADKAIVALVTEADADSSVEQSSDLLAAAKGIARALAASDA